MTADPASRCGCGSRSSMISARRGGMPATGMSAAVSMDSWAFLAAMFFVGVGWNLASSGGSALVTASYRPAERGRVQPIAELTTTVVQVGPLAFKTRSEAEAELKTIKV